jgi:hypothetical protein
MNRRAIVRRIDVWSKTSGESLASLAWPKTWPAPTHGDTTMAGTLTPRVSIAISFETLTAAGGGTWS